MSLVKGSSKVSKDIYYEQLYLPPISSVTVIHHTYYLVSLLQSFDV